jgi:hypothetical protein
VADTPVNRTERTLAVMVVTMVAASLAAFVAIMIGTAAGADFEGGLWPTVVAAPLVGMPLAILLIITLVLVSAVRRRRAGDAGR